MKKMNTLNKVFTYLIVLTITGVLGAQETQKDGNDAAKVAKQLANPNAVLGFFAVPIDYISYGGDLPDAASQSAFKVNWQPSLPYPLGENTNLFLRPLVPIIIQQPVFNGTGFVNKGVELGDIGFDLAIGHTFESKWMVVAGIVGSAPTATNPSLGLTQWSLGPEFLVGKTTSWGFFGALLTHSWGLSDSKRANVTGGQYFYTINLKNAWQIQGTPTYSYNHNGSSGNQFSFPLATGLSKTVIAGKMPLKFSLQYWYYIASPDAFGPKHQIRFTVIPVIPLPW
jgi:hypothetical protein